MPLPQSRQFITTPVVKVVFSREGLYLNMLKDVLYACVLFNFVIIGVIQFLLGMVVVLLYYVLVTIPEGIVALIARSDTYPFHSTFRYIEGVLLLL